MRVLIILALLANSLCSFGQNNVPVTIQCVTLRDEVLKKEIINIIAEESNSNDPDSLFKKGLGYVVVHIQSYSRGDTLTKYYIAPSLISLKEKDFDDNYPNFYSYVGGRIVLIYINEIQKSLNISYSDKSKSELRKKLDQFLEKTTDQTFFDNSGNKAFRDKKFRIDHFKFDAGKYVYIMKNKLPVIIREKNIRRY